MRQMTRLVSGSNLDVSRNRGRMEYSSLTGTFVKWALVAAVLSMLSTGSAAEQAPASSKPDPPAESQSTSVDSNQVETATPTIAPLAVPVTNSRTDQVKGGNGTTTGPKQTSGISKDRLFFALPNFLTLEDARSVPPLTTAEKYRVLTRSSFDYAKFFWYGALAGIGQEANSQSGYGQGAAGYGKRYGAALADGTIEDYLTGAILPSLLHQDPRYFQLGKGGFWHRTSYALSRIVVTRGDSGHNQFNFSEVLGSGAASSIGTYSYYPRSDRTAGNVLSVWGSQLGIDAFVTVLKEFWPDIRRKLHGPK